MCTMYAWRPVEGIKSPGIGFTSCCESPSVGAGNQTAESSLQAQHPALFIHSHNLEAEEGHGWLCIERGYGTGLHP